MGPSRENHSACAGNAHPPLSALLNEANGDFVDALGKVAATLSQMQVSDWVAHQDSERREIACPGSPIR